MQLFLALICQSVNNHHAPARGAQQAKYMKTKKMFANDGREVTDGAEVRWIGDAGEPQFWRIRTVECAFDGFVDLEGGITVPISEVDSVLTKEELAFCD